MPRLIEKLRGKSGEDLLNEVKSAFDTDRRMFFDRPGWNTRNPSFPRGFPFDDDFDGSSRRPRWDFDERRSRHPSAFSSTSGGFGEELHEPPWEEDDLPQRKCPRPPAETEEEPESFGAHGLNQHGLRNTVPLVQQQEPCIDDPQRARAMSAPPGDRPQKFVSKCEIPIQQPEHQQASRQGPPPQQHQGSNVRVIPIQVEGRDKPLINTNIDSNTSHFNSEASFDGRLPRDFGPYKKHSARFAQQQSPPATKKFQAQQQQQPQQPTKKASQGSQMGNSPQQSFDQPDSAPTPPQSVPLDAVARCLAQVAAVQKDVDELAKIVEAANVSSRSDKEYMYLDEMLTRQLLKLDNIDPDGHENVRQARKNTIKSIQKCISILEGKVPVEAMEVEGVETEEKEELMDVTKNPSTNNVLATIETTEEAVAENNGSIKVPVEKSNEPVKQKEEHTSNVPNDGSTQIISSSSNLKDLKEGSSDTPA